jgi:hypothetical protein
MAINPLRGGDIAVPPIENRDFADTQGRASIKDAVARSAPTADKPNQPVSPRESLAAIVREAARRAGVMSGAESYSEKDIRAVNEQIRKDSDLAQAVALARGMNRRGKGEADDDNEVGLDKGAGTRRGDDKKVWQADKEDGGESAEGDSGVSGASRLARGGQTGFQPHTGASPVSDGDLVVNMLNMFDVDGDGIITVRQFLEYIIQHAGEHDRFNEIELSNLIKILSESIDAAPPQQGLAHQPEDSLLAGGLDAIADAVHNSGLKRGLAA